MSKKKVLITGKLPKVPNEQSKHAFYELSKKLGKEVTTLYPTVFAEPTATWDESIRSDISKLMTCSDLHLLHNWQGHKRSEILRNIALSIGIKCHYH